MINKSDIEICRSNIGRHTKKSAENKDALEYHLKTAAKIVCRGTKTVGNTDQDFAAIRSNMDLLSAGDTEIPVGIYKYISDILFDGGIYSFAEKMFPERLPPEPYAVYLKNAYADKAFDGFSKSIPGLRYAYADSFSEGCEAVYDGRYETVILPCGEGNRGMPERTAGLIDVYGLKKICGCSLEKNDGEEARFALFAAGIYLNGSSLDGNAELSLSCDKNADILRRQCELAELLGVDISEVGVTGRQRERFRFVHIGESSFVPAMICFFACESGHFEIDGIVL